MNCEQNEQEQEQEQDRKVISLLIEIRNLGPDHFRASSGGSFEEGTSWHEALGNLLYYHDQLGVRMLWL